MDAARGVGRSSIDATQGSTTSERFGQSSDRSTDASRGALQLRSTPAPALAAQLEQLTQDLARLAATLQPNQPAARSAGSFVDPRTSDAQARRNELLRESADRLVATKADGYTVRQVADRNLALQGWDDASSAQVAREATRLGRLNGITDLTRRLRGHVITSDNGVARAEAIAARTKLNARRADPTVPKSTPDKPDAGDTAKATNKSSRSSKPDAPNKPAKPAAAGGDIPSSAKLTVKGKPASEAQRRNLEAVLDVGKRMGASDKVLQAAVATVIQEFNAENVDHGDRDSLGLFQQRPSMGWGSAKQVRDPQHAARKFFEQAIPSDKRNPRQSITQLAQSVQRSGYPGAYAQWTKEADAIVGAWKSGAANDGGRRSPQRAAAGGGAKGDLAAPGGVRGKMVELAHAEVDKGVREDSPDSDRKGNIRRYRTAVTGPGENPRAAEAWCADFVSWIRKQAGAPVGPRGQGSDYVKQMQDWAKASGDWHARGPHRPQPGDLVTFDWNGDEHPDHVGMVERVEGGKLTTIEGNTSAGGQAQGVHRKHWDAGSSKIMGFITPTGG